MKKIFLSALGAIIFPYLSLSQDTLSRWFVKGQLAEWDFRLNDQTFNLHTQLGLGKQLGTRWLVWTGAESRIEGGWASSGMTNWYFKWNPTWIGIAGRGYFKKITHSALRLNPYLGIRLGGTFWSSDRINLSSGKFERVLYLDAGYLIDFGASVGLIRELSLDIQVTYFPYSEKQESNSVYARPHEFITSISLNYWFERQKSK